MISCSYSTSSLGSWTATSISFCFLRHSDGISSFDFICRSIIPMFSLLKYVRNEFYKLAHYLNATKRLGNYLAHFLFGRDGLRGRFFSYESGMRKRKIRQITIIFLSKVLQYIALRKKKKKKKYFSMQKQQIRHHILHWSAHSAGVNSDLANLPCTQTKLNLTPQLTFV